VKKNLLFMIVVLVAAPLLVAGCASTSNPSPSPSTTTATVSATTTAATSNTSTSTATSSVSPSVSAGSQTVAIPDLSFQPSSLTIQRGASVTWRNDASVSHQIVSDTNAFSSPVLNPGASYTHVFDQAGTYPYHCAIHPSMTGTITVQ
jgi:plastocyanin